MVDASVPTMMKGKQREQPVVTPLPCEPEVMVQKPCKCISALKEVPRFEVTNPTKSSNEKMRSQAPQYKYATELMNETNQEQVFQMLLDQPVTLRLGELLGTSYNLGKRFQMATHSQHFPVQQAKAVNVEVLNSMDSMEKNLGGECEGDLIDLSEPLEFEMNSGEASSLQASTEELHELTYQNMMQEEYHRQFVPSIREVDLVCPHEYCTMVTVCLNG